MIEMGIEVQMISVERRLRRNRKMMATTRMAPRIAASWTEAIDRLMKTELSSSTDSCTPGISVLMRADLGADARRQSATVF